MSGEFFGWLTERGVDFCLGWKTSKRENTSSTPIRRRIRLVLSLRSRVCYRVLSTQVFGPTCQKYALSSSSFRFADGFRSN